MISAWTKHLKDPVEKEQFQNQILGSKLVLERIEELLKEMEADLDNADTNYRSYDMPNWDYRQADNNGFRRALKAVKKLISLDQTERKS